MAAIHHHHPIAAHIIAALKGGTLAIMFRLIIG